MEEFIISASRLASIFLSVWVPALAERKTKKRSGVDVDFDVEEHKPQRGAGKRQHYIRTRIWGDSEGDCGAHRCLKSKGRGGAGGAPSLVGESGGNRGKF